MKKKLNSIRSNKVRIKNEVYQVNKKENEEIIERLNDDSEPVEANDQFWKDILKDSEDQENN